MILKGINDLPLNEQQKIQLAGDLSEDFELLFRYGVAIATESPDEGPLGDQVDDSLDRLSQTWLGLLTRNDFLHWRRLAVEAQRENKSKELTAELQSLAEAA